MIDAQRNTYLMRTYGITLLQYDRILKAQGGTCAICDAPPPLSGRAMHVDHDHKSGLVRGILCFHCNRTVIGRGSIVERFERAADYLRNPPARGVLGMHTVPKKIRKRRKSL